VAWALIKSIAGEVLGIRTLMLTAGAAVAGGTLVAALGLALLDPAIDTLAAPSQIRWTILVFAGIVYALAGAYAAGQTILINSMQRSLNNLQPTIRPVVERLTAAMLSDLPQAPGGIEIVRIDALLDRLFDSMSKTTTVPILRHFARGAAAVGRWRLHRELDPWLEPLRRSGRTHVSADDLRARIIDAGCYALIAPAADQLARARRTGVDPCRDPDLSPICLTNRDRRARILTGAALLRRHKYARSQRLSRRLHTVPQDPHFTSVVAQTFAAISAVVVFFFRSTDATKRPQAIFHSGGLGITAHV
jgi:hypothetical protein